MSRVWPACGHVWPRHVAADEMVRQAIGREMNHERVRFNVTQSMAPYAYSVPKKLKATERRVDAGSALPLGAMLAPLAGAGAASSCSPEGEPCNGSTSAGVERTE